MKNKKGITIYDISSELNVSPSTVSRALKNHHSISKKTIRAVKKLAAERGYRPNGIAASLRKSKTNTIGVIISWVNRPFMSSLISGIEQAANAEGYHVIISQSYDVYEKEVTNARLLYDTRVGGLVVSLAMESQDYGHFHQFIDNHVPVVFVDRVVEDINCDLVVIDNYSAGYSATQHLIQQGCSRIAHIGGLQNRNVYRDRQRGYIQALKDYGLPVDENLIIESEVLSAEEGTKAADFLFSLPIPPDGIFSANDTAAVSVIQLAKSRKIKIPEELAIIGFNNDPISSIIEPSLSTISHPAVEMGRLAAQQVLRKNDRLNFHHETTILKTEIIARESSNRLLNKEMITTGRPENRQEDQVLGANR